MPACLGVRPAVVCGEPMSVAFWQCRDEEEAISPWQPPGVGGDGGRVVGRWCANVVWKCLRGSGSWVAPHTDSGIEARS